MEHRTTRPETPVKAMATADTLSTQATRSLDRMRARARKADDARTDAAHTARAAVFDCPCRTGHRLMVNLDRTRHPFWRIESRRPLSIRPSIDDITSERRCHFIIRDGKLRWAIATNGE